MSVLLIASLAVLVTATLGSVMIMMRTGESRVALLTGLFLLLGLQQGVALSDTWGMELAFDLATASALAGLGIGLLGLLSVFALGRTLGELESAESLHWDSMEGVRSLTELASRHEMALEDRLPLVLEMGRERLGLEIGLVSRVRGSRYEVLAIDAPETFPIGPGAAFELADTFCSTTLGSDRPVAVNRASDFHAPTSPARNPFHFEAYLGCAIRVHGEVRGTLVFASLEPRKERFTASHKDLLVLMGQWIAAEQERGELSASERQQTELAEAEHGRREQAEQELEQSRREASERSAPVASAIRRARRRTANPEPRPVDLNAILSRLEKRLRRVLPSNIELALKKSKTLTELPPQRLPLDAIVMSLVRKAAEAMPEGGVVTVSTADHEAAGGDPHEMQAVAPARYVTLSVAESSGAVDADSLSRVFDAPAGEPSPGVDAEGGLPLATVYRLLQRVGGDLSVEVEPGSGSRFVVFLPLEAETQRPAAAGRSEAAAVVSVPGH